jgi:hypothetical protein
VTDRELKSAKLSTTDEQLFAGGCGWRDGMESDGGALEIRSLCVACDSSRTSF